MYFKEGNRYDMYTSRYDVYLFTLRDYSEQINLQYGGTYIERSDMPLHAGYLLKFNDATRAVEFIKSNATSSETTDRVTTYVLPHTNGNELPVYATTATFTNVIYIGLSAYPEALNEYILPTFTVSFNANSGSGTMDAVQVPEDYHYKAPESAFTAPENKMFSAWNTAADGSGIAYAAGSTIEITEDLTLYAQWVDAALNASGANPGGLQPNPDMP